MNPVVLVFLIVGGLVLIDLLLRFARKPATGQLASEAEAVEQLCREYPELEASALGRVVLTADRRAAFIPVASGTTGFVCGLGDRFIVRQLHPSDIRELGREGEKAMRIRFNEVALRPMRLEFADMDARDLVLDLLGATHQTVKTA